MTQANPTNDTRLTVTVLVAVLLLVLIVAALVAIFGMHVLGFVGIAATLLVFVVLLGFTAGN